MGDEDTKLYTKCEIKKGFLGTPWFSHGLDCTEGTPSDLPTYTNQLEVIQGTNVNGHCEVTGSKSHGIILHCDSTGNVSVAAGGKGPSQIEVVSQGNSTDVYCKPSAKKKIVAWNSNPKGGFDCSEIP